MTNPAEPQEGTRKFVKEMQYRQKEFYNQWKYLSDREKETAEELNKEVTLYNENPSGMALQRIEGLKIKLIENLQDQIINDRSYVIYLERKLSELLGHGFTTLELQEVSDGLKAPSPTESFTEEVARPVLKRGDKKINKAAEELMDKIAQFRSRDDIIKDRK